MRPVMLATALVLLASGPAYGQAAPDTSGAVEPDIGDLHFDDVHEDVAAAEADQLAERYAALAADPVDLNTASMDDLVRIPLVTPLLARRILDHRKKHGPYGAPRDLLAVEGVTDDLFRAVHPFVVTGRSAAPSQRRLGPVRGTLLQRFVRRVDLGRGYRADTSGSHYLGTPERLLTRLRVYAGDALSANLTLEKDPGEPVTWAPAEGSYGFDFVSGHLALHNAGPLRTLVAGDYAVEVGQGLLFWPGRALGKGGATIGSVLRTGRGIVPYGSTDENRFFRGVAATLDLHARIAVSAFASRRRLDATLEGGPSETVAVGRPITGLHRTPAERRRKDRLPEALAGGSVAYTSRHVHAGLTAYRTRYGYPIARGTRPDQAFDFEGRQAALAGLYLAVLRDDAALFGEGVVGPGGTAAIVGGVALDRPFVDAVLVARHYPPGFHSPHGHAFGEGSSRTQNETGVFAGLRLQVARAWTLTTHVDQYRFPWLRYGVPRPTTGYDARARLDYRPRRWLSAALQFHTETQETSYDAVRSDGVLLRAVRPATRRRLRFDGTYLFNERLRLRVRVEAVRYDETNQPVRPGTVVFQDLRWVPARRLRVDARLAVFDAEHFEARVFTYEPGLLYAFSVPALHGRGQRSYVLLRYEPAAGLVLQLKWANSRFEDVLKTGSGLDETEGNRIREVAAQLYWRW